MRVGQVMGCGEYDMILILDKEATWIFSFEETHTLMHNGRHEDFAQLSELQLKNLHASAELGAAA